ncbi:sulfotransferase family protein [Marinigracilibium pacificum]|uniref:Sulfotransferase domain-containing protein n=1 Tax=Marinigracilibium pacificum TaxID=2729599 RepID=A0A848IWJ8_9BACT|nr:sulfotransferase [Marinigracilibium pacificum]NMM48046.1 sulfotransferase domain-containing protein [Marinigracilibium pacificum]
MQLPEFIIIGAMKSGTTTLDRNLLNHSQIGFTKTKEPNFFNRNFDKGIDWYLNQFQDNKEILGETSPNYSRRHIYPETVHNMYSTKKDLKIIYLVRDPIKRLVSHLHHDLYRHRIKSHEIDELIKIDSDYIKTSKYYYQIEPFIESFGLENIKVILFEEFINKPDKVLNDICSFLNVRYEKILFKPYNVTGKKYLIKYHDQIHNIFGNNKISKLYHLFWYLVGIKINKPHLDDNNLENIKELLSEDICEFKKTFTENDYSYWPSF